MGCCSLRVEHVQLHPEADGCPYVVEFDFLGKDSIRYYNKVPVEKPVSACVGGGGSRPSDVRPLRRAALGLSRAREDNQVRRRHVGAGRPRRLTWTRRPPGGLVWQLL